MRQPWLSFLCDDLGCQALKLTAWSLRWDVRGTALKAVNLTAFPFQCIVVSIILVNMMTSSNGNIFRVTGPLCGEFTCHRWIPPHKGQWRGALMFPLICAWTNIWVNNRDVSDLRRHRAHYGVNVMNRVWLTSTSSRQRNSFQDRVPLDLIYWYQSSK